MIRKYDPVIMEQEILKMCAETRTMKDLYKLLGQQFGEASINKRVKCLEINGKLTVTQKRTGHKGPFTMFYTTKKVEGE